MTTAIRIKQRLREDGTPYYVQLAAIIRRQITDGSLDIGDKLPTLRNLVETFGVSPMTVRHALAGLEKEGLISLERGRGTFVVAKPETPESLPFHLTRFPSSNHGALSFRVAALRPAKDELRILEEDGEAFSGYRYMKRIFSRDGQPFNTGEYLIADEVFEAIPDRQWSSELISTLLYDNRQIGLSAVRQKFKVIASTPPEAAELNIHTHDPVVQVRRIFLNERRQVLCLAQLVYRTDGVVFDINIDIGDRDRLLELGGVPES